MSGYAGATLVVEASWRSGARLQARLATQHGRPLFFTKQMLNEDWVHQYIRLPSVHVIENADDVIAALGRYRIDGNTLEWEAGDND
jgi:DNA processing protein